MKEVTLRIEDDHYEVIEKLAGLRKMKIEDMMLEAAKCMMTGMLERGVDEAIAPTDYDIHELLGGSKSMIQFPVNRVTG